MNNNDDNNDNFDFRNRIKERNKINLIIKSKKIKLTPNLKKKLNFIDNIDFTEYTNMTHNQKMDINNDIKDLFQFVASKMNDEKKVIKPKKVIKTLSYNKLLELIEKIYNKLEKKKPINLDEETKKKVESFYRLYNKNKYADYNNIDDDLKRETVEELKDYYKWITSYKKPKVVKEKVVKEKVIKPKKEKVIKEKKPKVIKEKVIKEKKPKVVKEKVIKTLSYEKLLELVEKIKVKLDKKKPLLDEIMKEKIDTFNSLYNKNKFNDYNNIDNNEKKDTIEELKNIYKWITSYKKAKKEKVVKEKKDKIIKPKKEKKERVVKPKKEKKDKNEQINKENIIKKMFINYIIELEDFIKKNEIKNNSIDNIINELKNPELEFNMLKKLMDKTVSIVMSNSKISLRNFIKNIMSIIRMSKNDGEIVELLNNTDLIERKSNRFNF